MMASPSPRSTSTREGFLENKILILEQRLTLVEKFVELRFKDAFQNFVASERGDGDLEDDEVGIGTGSLTAAKPKSSPAPTRTMRNKGSSKVKDSKTKGTLSRLSLKRRLVEKHSDLELESTGGSYPKVEKKEEDDNDDFQKPPKGRAPRSKRSEKDSPKAAVKTQRVSSSSEHDGVFDIESYIEFSDEGEGHDGLLQGSLKGVDATSGRESPIFCGNFLKIELGKQNSNKRGKPSRKPSGSGKKSEGVTTPLKKKVIKTSLGSTPPKKRIYVPALCSNLPSVARADPSRKECPMCHMHIKNDLFDAHVDSHVKERHLKCPFCDKTYFNQAMLRKHRIIHKPEKYGRPCRICEKMFFQTDKKLAHERFCVKRAFERKEHVDPEIVQDLKNRNPNWTVETKPDPSADSEELKECPHCHKMFKASFYQRHLKGHTEAKQWICKKCDKAYYHKHDLVRHYGAEHRPPICDLCSKTFKNKKQLTDHVEGCRKKQGALKMERKSTKSEAVDSEDIHVEFVESGTQNLVSHSEQVLDEDLVQALASSPSFNVDGATVTILSEDLIVVANDIEVPESEEPQHSITVATTSDE